MLHYRETESSHTSQCPVVRALESLHDDEGDVGEVCALRLLVDGAAVEAVVGGLLLDGIHVYDRQDGKEHLGLGIH